MDMQTITTPAESSVERAARILVVDDNEANRESLSRRLQRHAYAVVTAADGPAALELIERDTFDLVLLDIMMPGMSGLEVLARVRKRYSPTDLPIIMATAQNESQDIVGALDGGANDYVTKPFEFAVVLARVRTQLSLKRSVDRVLDLEKRLSARNVELEGANTELQQHAQRIAFELDAAARVQKTFLPSASLHTIGCTFAYAYEPCEKLAGDSLNILQLDSEHVALYIMDVSGHGVAASLLAVAATRLLSEVGRGSSLVMELKGGVMTPVAPAKVAATLNQRFLSNPETSQYLTLFYAVFHARSRMLTYVSAGHPGAIHVGRSTPPRTLEGSNLPIGFGQEYEQGSVQLEEGDRVYLYSDGVTDARNAEGEMFDNARLHASLQNSLKMSLSTSLEALKGELRHWQGSAASNDDISVLAIECIGGG